MAKIVITVKQNVTSEVWEETYDRPDITTIERAREWSKSLIDHFNATCRPGEATRTLQDTKLAGKSTDHTWVKRTDGMSVEFRGRLVDLFFCTQCHITGKRVSLNGSVRRDSKYRAKKYGVCDKNRRDEDA